MPANISIIGIPNSGKTTLFNKLTNKKAKTGNYSGVTVVENSAEITYNNNKIKISDLPGLYSLYVNSNDEFLSLNHILENSNNLFILVSSVDNIRNSIKILLQLKKLNVNIVLVINKGKKDNTIINYTFLEKELGIKVIYKDVRKINLTDFSVDNYVDLKISKEYSSWLKISQKKDFLIDNTNKIIIDFNKEKIAETINFSKKIDEILKKNIIINLEKSNFQNKLDKILIHKIFGIVIFIIILFLSFDLIFRFSNFFSNYIDILFSNLISFSNSILKSFQVDNFFSDLISKGILPALSGITIFIPQIFILFFFIRFLEESGYMTRVIFLMDKFMKSLGLSSKSIIPYISGTTCSVPSILACRTIENKTQRFITILTIPFTTCSAKIPIYIILISLVVPNKYFLGIINLQSLALFTLYILGFSMAILSAILIKYFSKDKFKNKETKFLIEFPKYQLISFKDLFIYSYEKSKEFFFGIARIIIILSTLLWFLSSYNFFENKIQKTDLEKSFMGDLGKNIEPLIEPLGYDWKIGISLISSIAAREAFIGSLASIYGVSEDESSLLTKMRSEINPKTGKNTFNFATGISILIFYAFAIQCISTLIITKNELKSWKYPILQFIIMNSFAYLSAMGVYNLLK